MKRIIYYLLVESPLAKLISSPVLKLVIPPLVFLYYGTLDIWGDSWSIITNYPEFHEAAYSFLALATISIVLLNGVSESLKSLVEGKYFEMHKSMSTYCNGLVKVKTRTVYERARQLRPNSNAFKRVIRPKEQLDRSIDDIQRLLVDGFGVDESNIGITIISRKRDTKWFYEFKNKQQRNHTSADKIMRGDSIAKYCHEDGEALFISDIRKGEKEKVFLPSTRSSSTGIGSVFCKPVRIVVNQIEFYYIFTIAVYGEFLCTPHSREESTACGKVLNEIADRIELELNLLSVQKFTETGGQPQ